MILIPIGHEEEGTRRWPWVTLGILGFCVLAFLLTGFGGSRSEWNALEAHERAIAYWMERPYLRLDPDVERTMHGVATTETRATFQEGLRTFVEKPDAQRLAAEQKELDRLCGEAKNEAPDHPFFRWGLVPSDLRIVTLISHTFLHAGWLHLLGNLFLLYLCAPFLEDVWGRPIFAAFYAVAGIVAALTFVVAHSDLSEPLVGASGAIAGVVGAFAVRYARTKVQFFYMIGLGAVRGTFWAPAWLMLGLWFAQQIFLAMLASGEGPGGKVAYLAHAGGFAFGAAVAFAFKKYEVEERWIAGAIEAKTNKVLLKNEAVETALQAAAAGNALGAFDLLAEEVRRSPASVDAAVAFFATAQEIGREKEAAQAFARAIEHEVKTGQIDAALVHWDELRAKVPTATLEGRALVRLAGAYARSGARKEASDALRRALLVASKAPTPALLVKIAETAADVDPVVARAAASAALARADLDEAGKNRVRVLV